MTAAVAVGCALASMAARLPGYEHLHAVVPLFWSVRVQAHMGQVVLLALAVLAGFGAWQVAERVGARAAGLAARRGARRC